MSSVEGVEEMIAELEMFTELFQAADREIDELVEPLHQRLGLTPAMFAAHMAELTRGEPMEPLPKTRKPKREEVVVGVYNAPSLTTRGKSMLVFVTDDGIVWQLCDAGLGWSPYDSVDVQWTPVSKFADLLPARINPRPPAVDPWTFDLVFGEKAKLRVRPGSLPGEVAYILERSQ